MDSKDFHIKSLLKDLLLYDLKSAESKARQIILNAIPEEKVNTCVSLMQVLFTQANFNCKKLKYKVGVAIRKLVDKLHLDVPGEVYLAHSYEFLNYYSCALRDSGKLYKAKMVASKAIELSNICPTLNKSDSLMNMCAILSTSGKHAKALNFAREALSCIKSELKQVKSKENKEKIREKYTKVAISYYNLAVEEEFCGNIHPALFNYENSLMILEINLISEEGFLEKVKDCVNRLRKLKKEKEREKFSARARSQMKIIDSKKETSSTFEVRKSRVETSSSIKSAKKVQNKYIEKKFSIVKKLMKASSKNRIILKNPSINSLKTQDFNEKIQDFEEKTQVVKEKTQEFKDKPEGFKEKLENFNKKNEEFTTFETNDKKKGFLEFVVKIQAFIRGSIQRENFRLSRKVFFKKFLMKRWKHLDREMFLVKVFQEKDSLFIEACSADKKLSMTTENTLNLNEIFKRLSIESGVLTLKPFTDKPKLLIKAWLTVQNQEIEVEYLILNKKLTIALQYEQKELSKEILLPHEVNKATPLFILEKIHPKLAVVNEKLSLLDYSCDKKANILINNSLSQISLTLSELTVDYFLDSELILTLSRNAVKAFPEALYLKLSSKSSPTQQFKSRPIHKIKHLLKEKQLLNNGFEYFINVFAIKDKKPWFFFSADSEDAPAVVGTSYSKLDLKKFFGFSMIENNLPAIIKKLVLVNNVLDLHSSVSQAKLPDLDVNFNIEKVIVEIQAIYRGNRTRDMLKLQRSDNQLIISVSKLVDHKPVNVRIFKLASSYLIELVRLSEKLSFYYFVKDPLEFVTVFFRFSHLNLLINALKIKDPPHIEDVGGVLHELVQCTLDSEEVSASSFVVHKPDEQIVVLGLVFSDKSVLAKIYDYKSQEVYVKKYSLPSVLELVGKFDIPAFLHSFRIIDKTVSHSVNVKIQPRNLSDISDKVVYRTCIKIMEVLYQVSVYQEGENLRFVYKRGSNIGLGIEFGINLKVALERSGFTESLLIPMVNYFIKKILVMKDDEVVMNSNKSVINFERIICKIQAVFRSYLLRKKMKGRTMRLLLKVKKPEKDTIFTVLLYDKFDRFALFAVNLAEVIKKEIPKHRGDTAETVLKAHINDLFAFREEGKKMPGTLKFAKKIRTFLTEPTQSHLVLFAASGIISGHSVSLILSDLSFCEMVEARFEGKVLSFEISSAVLPRNEKIFRKLEISEKGDLTLMIPQRKIMFFQMKKVSGHDCRILLCTKAQKFQIIVNMIRSKKYFLTVIGKKVDMVKFIDRLKILKGPDSYSVSY